MLPLKVYDRLLFFDQRMLYNIIAALQFPKHDKARFH